jgi:pimeloyl-ACP methyl ester carboxylesterase
MTNKRLYSVYLLVIACGTLAALLALTALAGESLHLAQHQTRMGLQFDSINVEKPEKPKPIAETLQPYLFPVQYVKLKNNMTIAYIDEDSSFAANQRARLEKTIVIPERNRKRSKSSTRRAATAPASIPGREPIIFLHGLNGYIPIWNKQITELRKNHRCIALDLPGFGRSSKSQNYTISIFTYADAVIKFMDALNIQQATIVGHSMGGQIALNLGMRYARRINRLVLVSSTGLEPFTEQERRAFHENVTENTTKLKTDEQIRSDFGRFFFGQPPKDSFFWLRDRLAIRYSTDFDAYCYTVKNSTLGIVDMPTYDMLENVSQNVLVVYGQHDNYIPNPFFHSGQRANDIGEYAKQRLRYAKLLIVPKSGHFVQYEAPEALNKAMNEFIR